MMLMRRTEKNSQFGPSARARSSRSTRLSFPSNPCPPGPAGPPPPCALAGHSWHWSRAQHRRQHRCDGRGGRRRLQPPLAARPGGSGQSGRPVWMHVQHTAVRQVRGIGGAGLPGDGEGRARAPKFRAGARSRPPRIFSFFFYPLHLAAPPPGGATPIPAAAGRIEIITGPMFAGKSTELLRRVAAHEVRK